MGLIVNHKRVRRLTREDKSVEPTRQALRPGHHHEPARLLHRPQPDARPRSHRARSDLGRRIYYLGRTCILLWRQ